MSRRALAPLLALASLFLASNALADGAYCGDTLVHSGDASTDVRAACGAPARIGWHDTYRPASSPRRRERTHLRHINVEEWYYADLGPGTLPRVFFFEDGILTEVHVGTSVTP